MSGALCNGLTSQTQLGQVNSVQLNCSDNPKTTNQYKTCHSHLNKLKICSAELIFTNEPAEPSSVSLTDKGGCQSDNSTLFLIKIEGPKYVHKPKFKLIVESEIEDLAVVEILRTGLDDSQTKDLLRTNFKNTRTLKMQDNAELRELQEDYFAEMKNLDRLYLFNNGITSISSRALIVGPQWHAMVVRGKNSGKVSLAENAIQIVKANCRPNNRLLEVKLVGLGLSTKDMSQNSIIIQSDAGCNSTSEITIDLRDNSFGGEIDEKMFGNLIVRNDSSSANLTLVFDPLDCCRIENAWLFNQSSTNISAKCRDLKKSSQGIKNSAQLDQFCKELSNGSKMLVEYIIIGVAILSSIVVIICVCSIWPRSKSRGIRSRASRRSRRRRSRLGSKRSSSLHGGRRRSNSRERPDV